MVVRQPCGDLLPGVVDLQRGGGCRLPGCPSRRASSSDRPAGRSTSRLCRVSTSPLSVEALRARLVAPHGPYAALDVVPSTGSTNSDLAEAARAGAADRTVLIAEEQTAGRGRLQRNWASAPGAGLYLSVLLRPAGVPTGRLGWLPLLAGIALVRLARNTAGVPAVVKWPNDLLAGERSAKCAGVLAEVVGGPEGPAAVLGIGLNVTQRAEDLPSGPGGLAATSLAAEGASRTDRTELAAALLD